MYPLTWKFYCWAAKLWKYLHECSETFTAALFVAGNSWKQLNFWSVVGTVGWGIWSGSKEWSIYMGTDMEGYLWYYWMKGSENNMYRVTYLFQQQHKNWQLQKLCVCACVRACMRVHVCIYMYMYVPNWLEDELGSRILICPMIHNCIWICYTKWTSLVTKRNAEKCKRHAGGHWTLTTGRDESIFLWGKSQVRVRALMRWVLWSLQNQVNKMMGDLSSEAK